MAKNDADGFGAWVVARSRQGLVMAMLGVMASAGATGCASSHVLTQGEIGRKGARSFALPPTTVFYACSGALLADGYEIASSDLEHGVIVTKPLAVAGQGSVTARSYRITITPDGRRGTRVVAAPYLYSGSRDVSEDEVWNLDGPHGEVALWNDLFDDINGVVVRSAPETAIEREALAKAAATPADAPGGGKTAAPNRGLTPATLGPTPRAPARRPTSAE